MQIDRWVAYKNHVEQLGIDEIMKYSVSTAKLILRIFEAYLAKNPQIEISFFKDKFALIVTNMEFFGKGDLGKQFEIRKGFGELLQYAKASYEDLFIHLIVSTIFDLMRLICPVASYLRAVGEEKGYDNAAYFIFQVDKNYFAYVDRFGTLCRKWNKLKREER
jgi:hypothetical protein